MDKWKISVLLIQELILQCRMWLPAKVHKVLEGSNHMLQEL